MKKTLKVLGIIGLVLVLLAVVVGLVLATIYTFSVVGTGTWWGLGAGLLVSAIIFFVFFKTRSK